MFNLRILLAELYLLLLFSIYRYGALPLEWSRLTYIYNTIFSLLIFKIRILLAD